jgi:hypothetical protein
MRYKTAFPRATVAAKGAISVLAIIEIGTADTIAIVHAISIAYATATAIVIRIAIERNIASPIAVVLAVGTLFPIGIDRICNRHSIYERHSILIATAVARGMVAAI